MLRPSQHEWLDDHYGPGIRVIGSLKELTTRMGQSGICELEADLQQWFSERDLVEKWAYVSSQDMIIFNFPIDQEKEAMLFKLTWGGR